MVGHGLLLQVDAPDLALKPPNIRGPAAVPNSSTRAEHAVDALNTALIGIDPGKRPDAPVWGNYEGPHTHDVNLDDILPVVYRANVGPSSSPWPTPPTPTNCVLRPQAVAKRQVVLVAGVIDTTTNYVEHPEVVANRLVRISGAVGNPTRVIAGTDCGFDTMAGIGDIDPLWCGKNSAPCAPGLISPRPASIERPNLAEAAWIQCEERRHAHDRARKRRRQDRRVGVPQGRYLRPLGERRLPRPGDLIISRCSRVMSNAPSPSIRTSRIPPGRAVRESGLPRVDPFLLRVGHGNYLAYFDFPGLDLTEYREVLGGLHHIAISVTAEQWTSNT